MLHLLPVLPVSQFLTRIYTVHNFVDLTFLPLCLISSQFNWELYNSRSMLVHTYRLLLLPLFNQSLKFTSISEVINLVAFSSFSSGLLLFLPLRHPYFTSKTLTPFECRVLCNLSEFSLLILVSKRPFGTSMIWVIFNLILNLNAQSIMLLLSGT